MELTQTIAGLPLLPHALGDIESKAILKQLPKAHAALAELKGVAASMPNQSILVGTLSLQEAKDSSEIENIISTHHELYLSTAVRYLNALVDARILSKHKLGKDNYYFNTALYHLLDGVGERLITGQPL
ncbi:Fic/DOC family N-terminal domain-containing protein [Limnobacter sp.]|uniref:Fic/DOC family N-terminal domain-containing protein n=1 Tax=Limnobacter sp. TaxID=2003368 RepID=UPI002736BE7F|nr:Fic/DOC family N-terminal domain-containing protein [Limnobacter sp.]MDP3189273.1 Fic/DOC family N-terminal domain-containing protein [Limnobacter sp.]